MYKSIQQSFSLNYTNSVKHHVLDSSATTLNKSRKISIKSSGKGKTIGRKLIQKFFNKTKELLLLNKIPSSPQQSGTKHPIVYTHNNKSQKSLQTNSSLQSLPTADTFNLNEFLNMRVFFQTNKKRMGVFKYHRRLLRRSRV